MEGEEARWVQVGSLVFDTSFSFPTAPTTASHRLFVLSPCLETSREQDIVDLSMHLTELRVFSS